MDFDPRKLGSPGDIAHLKWGTNSSPAFVDALKSPHVSELSAIDRACALWDRAAEQPELDLALSLRKVPFDYYKDSHVEFVLQTSDLLWCPTLDPGQSGELVVPEDFEQQVAAFERRMRQSLRELSAFELASGRLDLELTSPHLSAPIVAVNRLTGQREMHVMAELRTADHGDWVVLDQDTKLERCSFPAFSFLAVPFKKTWQTGEEIMKSLTQTVPTPSYSLEAFLDGLRDIKLEQSRLNTGPIRLHPSGIVMALQNALSDAQLPGRKADASVYLHKVHFKSPDVDVLYRDGLRVAAVDYGYESFPRNLQRCEAEVDYSDFGTVEVSLNV